MTARVKKLHLATGPLRTATFSFANDDKTTPNAEQTTEMVAQTAQK
jgi:hypothetical protein